MKKTRLLLFLFLFFGSAKAQYWMQFGGGATIDEALDVDVDGSNNSYTTGYFTTTATVTPLSITSSGVDDIFILKTNDNGIPQWLKRAGGTSSDKGMSIDADDLGNIVVTGFFNGTAQFDAQAVTSAGQQDIFIAKYSSAGTLAWVIKAGGTGSDVGNAVTFDRAGNIIVTGEFTGTCTFGSITLTSAAGSLDVFTAKYNSSGTILWAKKGSGLLTDRGTDIEADSAGNIYVSGTCGDTVTFDVTHNIAFSNALFLIQYSAAGQEQWFRWMGSSNSGQLGGMDLRGGAISLTGDFTGTLYFFGGAGSPSLPGPQPYNIFVCRFDTAGTYLWSRADGSASEVSANGIATRANGNTVITGSFKCRFTDYSARYDDGIFCSIGYWDAYVSSYDNSGNFLWGRQYAGNRDDFSYSICLRNDSLAITTGSFEDKIISTNTPANFLGYNVSAVAGTGGYCADNNYYRYVTKTSAGNKDFYVNNNIELSREPFDFFYRSSLTCTRPYNDICIGLTQVSNLSCRDTIITCSPSLIYVNTNTYTSREPNWIYQWNTGSPGNQTNATVTGNYWVTVTSEDGCYSQTDSVYFDLLPFPPSPEISDDKGINTNSPGPAPVLLCEPDSVLLTCTNVGSNTVSWTGFPTGQNPVLINVSGDYTCTLTNAAGCVKATSITVAIYPQMQPIILKMICPQDTDNNDTIEVCLGDAFTMLPYDSSTNPLASVDSCIHELKHVAWLDTLGMSANLSFSTISSCGGGTGPSNSFVTSQLGSFDFIFFATVVRETVCDSDTVMISRSLHINVNPVPTIINFPITIAAASNLLCFGDSILLVAGGSTNYEWTDPGGIVISHNDSVYVHVTGTYTVSSDSTIVNAFGCSASLSSTNFISIGSYPQPTVSIFPVNGIICPNDSVQLNCTGTGTFSWQGPNGTIASTDSSIYVTTSGSYYCVLTVAPGCNLVSNTVQVSPYNNPIIIAFPAPSLCQNNSVQLTVVSGQGSVIQWLPPLSGSGAVQTVTDTGTYSCNVLSCNINTLLSFTIFRDTAVAQIFSSAPMPVFCGGDSVLLTSNSGMNHYLWLPSGDTATSTYISQGGWDTLITTSLHGCKDTATIFVTELPNTLLPPFVQDTSVCPGFPVDVFAISTDTVFWANTLSYTDTFYTGNSLHIPSVTAQVTYYVYTQSGICKSLFDSVAIGMDPCHDIFISNVITPDDNSQNDVFPEPGGNYLLDLKVFNRWGKLVFETTQDAKGWDGKNKSGEAVPDGTYYYILDVTFYDNTVQNFKGSLMVLKGE